MAKICTIGRVDFIKLSRGKYQTISPFIYISQFSIMRKPFLYMGFRTLNYFLTNYNQDPPNPQRGSFYLIKEPISDDILHDVFLFIFDMYVQLRYHIKTFQAVNLAWYDAIQCWIVAKCEKECFTEMLWKLLCKSANKNEK